MAGYSKLNRITVHVKMPKGKKKNKTKELEVQQENIMYKLIKHLILSIIFCLTTSCSSSKFCKEKIATEKKVNTTKPFYIKNKYCIESIVKINDEKPKFVMYVLDRVSGKPLDGVAFFTTLTSTKKVKFFKGILKVELLPKDYIIEIAATGKNSEYSIPFIIKKIRLPISSIVKVNCFIGGIMER